MSEHEQLERLEVVVFVRGWYLLGSVAHYCERTGITLCALELLPVLKWTVPQHCGTIPLCERCRQALEDRCGRTRAKETNA